MILFDNDEQRVEARKGLVTILDKATGIIRIAHHDEGERWLDHWTRNLPGQVGGEPVKHPQGSDDDSDGA